jgi:Diadenosine tetraphosphate (Ap4A) hydrolase and other HIT family hydrolases
MFKIHKKFEKTTHYVTDLKLCQVRLQDNSKFPWIMLIPKRKGACQILDLNKKDQIQLLDEIQYCSKMMKKHFRCNNLNVEKVGNIVPQLHIHIVPRHKKIQLGHYRFGLLKESPTRKMSWLKF